jgi:spore germination cell wall hydrolase CwlJ-like protein
MQIAMQRFPAVRFSAFERKHWLSGVVLATIFALYLLAGLSIAGIDGTGGLASARVPSNLSDAIRTQAPPAPEPLRFRQIAPQQAVAINAAIPIAQGPNPAARAFLLQAGGDDRTRALECLTAAVYYESAIEPTEGQRAVAQVVLNRVRHPAYPKSVCGVVFQGHERSTGCQFTFTCDGALARTPHAGLWKKAREIAQAALGGYVYKPVGWATHYHTNWVVPYWSSSLTKVAVVGTHIFYRWAGSWGTGAAFRGGYAGAEPPVGKMRSLTSDPDTLAAAAAAEALTAEQLANAEKLPDGTVAPPSSVDSFQRAVLRRYEPMPGSAVTAILAEQAKDGGKTPSAAHRWALAGQSGTAGTPLGRKPAAAPGTAAAKPALPDGLEGVRKAPVAATPAPSPVPARE